MTSPYRLSTFGVLVLALGVFVCCSAEIFSSVSKMKILPRLERKLLKKFEDFFKSEDGGGASEELKGRIRQLQKSNSRILMNTSLLESPLHAFRLVKRLVKTWSSVFKSSAMKTTDLKLSAFLNSTEKWILNQDLWPSEIDMSGAAMAIVRLHNLYNLDYSTLSKGNFLNMTSQPMTSLELAYVTEAALNLGFICDAKELISALKARAKRPGGRTTRIARLQRQLSHLAIDGMTECDDRNNSYVMPTLTSLASKSYEARRQAVRTLYHQMCRKTMQASIVYGSGRECYQHSTFIPYLKFKAEVVNSDPLITVFHDVISDDEIREMKQLSFGKLSPSTLAVAQVAHEQQLIRVSQNAWLFDLTPTMKRVSQRVELITGLSTRMLDEDTHAEPYQVVSYGMSGVNGLHEDSVVLNYGLGGVYGPHEDSVRIPRQSGNENTPLLLHSGDRTATWMYYLSDVPLGGATVFPLLGAGIRPQKGTAAFWYNLRRSGEGEVRMVHAGCPVLYGDKWVANKWIREIGNIFRRPCLLDPNL
ncbi:hypothetical protein BaRGS_00036019 [Batillaria attramentaria]|uniref:procollagen-proline 4-dioxygenase n=1 Tax=Batillaria attramentaria TaxID=370345 RepID=A0ABD0JD48_9CAEN